MRSRQRGDYSLCFLKSFSHTSQLSDLRGVTGAATGATALEVVVKPEARTGGTNRFAALRLCASCWVGKSCDPEYGGGPGGKNKTMQGHGRFATNVAPLRLDAYLDRRSPSRTAATEAAACVRDPF